MGCDSATRQNSASQPLSRITQLTWFFGWFSTPRVSQRSLPGREVLKRTCAVLPVGLNGSRMALTCRPFSSSFAVMPLVMRWQAVSASSRYINCAG
ncbi:Uncharacterised protein [Bordetella pertussis]|nr:Uncharacterised protein [Bordetella pertussis]